MPLHRPLLFALALAAPARAQLTWSLASGNESWPADKRAAIIAAMNEAVALYNANGYFPKTLWANYSPGVPTAQASYSGWIDFGGSIGTRVALHEISHTLGVGQVAAWNSNRSGNTWTGSFAINRVKLFDGPSATLNADTQHFWPYGLNFDSEDGTTNRVRHIKMVSAMRRDMGIVTDSDNDGIPNDWEMFYFGSLAQSATGDADNDGTNNLAEYNADTNPAAATVQWTGATSSDWTTASNWSPAPAPSNGTFFTRINVNHNAGSPLVYDATRGTSVFRPADRGLVIGSGANNANTIGVMNLTGGSFSTAGAKSPDVIGNGQGNSGSLVIDGGSFTSDELHFGVSGQGSGTLTLHSGSASIASLVFNHATGGSGSVQLNGGTLTTTSITRTGSGGGTLRLNGGTLRAGASSTTFLAGLSSTLVQAGGATFDSSTHAITVDQALLHDPASPGGGLAKSGSGTLTLGGANTYLGPTQVNAGTLEAAHASALGGTAAGVTVANAATLALADNIATPAAESIAIAGVGAGSRGALQSAGGANTWQGPVSVTASGTRIGVQDGATLTITGNITESAAATALIFRAGLQPGSDIILAATGNAWTGSTSLFSSSATGGAVKLGATNALPPATLFLIAGPGVPGRLDLNGFDQTASGLTHSTAGSSAIGDGIVTNSAATLATLTLDLPPSTTREFIGSLQQGGGGGLRLVKLGTGTQILSGSNTHAGGTTLQAGTLRQGVANAFGSTSAPLTLQGGTANLNGLPLGIGALHGSAGSIANNASATEALLTLGHGNASGGEFSGSLVDRSSGTGTLALAKTGSGTQTLAGNNSFSGPASIQAGTLVAASPTALGSPAGPTTVASGASLRLADAVQVTGEAITLNGSGSSFNGALQAAENAAATWAGGVILGDAARLGAMPGGTLTVSGPIAGSGAFQSLSIGAGAGGSATVILAAPQGASTYSGTTAIIRGTLKLGAPHTLPASTVLDVDAANAAEDAILDLNGHPQSAAGLQRSNVSGGNGNGIVTNSHPTPATLTLAQESDTTFSGRLTGNLALVKSGAGLLSLTGTTHSYSGPTIVEAGTLALAGPVLADLAAVTLAGGAKLALNFAGSDSVASLSLGGVPMPPGSYSAASHPAYFTGSGSLVVPATLANWMNQFPTLSVAEKLPSADPDGDGSDNLDEFAFGGDPTDPASRGRRIVQLLDTRDDALDARDLTLTVEVRAGAVLVPDGPDLVATADGVAYRFEGSTDLATFASPVSEVLPHRGPASPTPGYAFKTIRLDASTGLPSKGFLRATATAP